MRAAGHYDSDGRKDGLRKWHWENVVATIHGQNGGHEFWLVVIGRAAHVDSNAVAAAVDLDSGKQQRDGEQWEQPQDPIPDEPPVTNALPVEQLCEQVATERHEQCYASVSLVQQGEREHGWSILVGHGRARKSIRVQEVPCEYHVNGHCPHMVQRDVVLSRRGLHARCGSLKAKIGKSLL